MPTRTDGRAMPKTWQRWADRSLMPTVKGRVTVHLTGCPALPKAAGCVYNNRPRDVYLKRGVQHIKAVFLHEMGHLFDLRVMNNGDRGRFRRIMRQPRKRRWWKGATPLAEQFAEAYSFCARYRTIVSISRYATYRYRPTSSHHLRGCALMSKAARDHTNPDTNPDADADAHRARPAGDPATPAARPALGAC